SSFAGASSQAPQLVRLSDVPGHTAGAAGLRSGSQPSSSRSSLDRADASDFRSHLSASTEVRTGRLPQGQAVYSNEPPPPRRSSVFARSGPSSSGIAPPASGSMSLRRPSQAPEQVLRLDDADLPKLIVERLPTTAAGSRR